MFYKYKLDTTLNWIHESLKTMMQLIHTNAQSSPPITWQALLTSIPDQHQSRLSSRSGLQTRLLKYQHEFRAAPKASQRVAEQMLLLSDAVPCIKYGIIDFPQLDDIKNSDLQDALKSLFVYVFEELIDLVRDDHYRYIYDAAMPKIKKCPFCCIEELDPPQSPQYRLPREPLDHYLAESLYPYFAANLQNLVPMCGKCNSSYKGAKDVLHPPNENKGTKKNPKNGTLTPSPPSKEPPCRSFYPYDHTQLPPTLDLSHSTLPTFIAEDIEWKVEFCPPAHVDYTEEIDTWDKIFKVKTRIISKELRKYDDYLNDFKGKVSTEMCHPYTELIEKIRQESRRFYDRGEHIEAAFFNMLDKKTSQNSQFAKRLHRFLTQ